MSDSFTDAVHGSLIAGAVGDAMGGPVEGAYWNDLVRDYGKVRQLLPNARNNAGDKYTRINEFRDHVGNPPQRPGLVTDDTTMRTYLCAAIIRAGGRVSPDDYAAVLLEKLNIDRVWLNERITLDKLRTGMNPWDTGRGNPPAGCASMLIAPIGIVNAGNPTQAYQDGYVIAGINQDGFNREGAATLAAGVAAAFQPSATAETIVDAMHRPSSYVYKRAIDIAVNFVSESEGVGDFCEKFYSSMLDWTWPSPDKWSSARHFSGSSLEIVPLVAAVVLLTRGDVNEAIVEGVAVGRDNDTISSLCGSIVGAMTGAGPLQQDWQDTVEEANKPFFKEVFGTEESNFRWISDQMVLAIENQVERATKELDSFQAIVNRR